MLSVEEALEKVAVATRARTVAVERVALDDALGRVLAEDVAMDHDVPPFDRAAMDGFVVGGFVAAGDRLRLVGRVAAGSWPDRRLGAGEAIRINTGAPLPEGTTRVVPVEWTTVEGDTVRIDRVPSDAAHVVLRGAHVTAGTAVLQRGKGLGPAALGALATAGCATVAVGRRPRVAVLATGSELVSVDAAVEAGQIRNSNAPLLRAAAREAGATTVDLGVARDEEDDLRARIREGLEADLLLLSGGVSMGDRDLVPEALEAEGVERVFHRWAVQPGGPLWFGRREETLVFGLPGNPAASFVGCALLVVPAIRACCGAAFRPRSTVRARYRGPWGARGTRRRFRPVRLASEAGGTLFADALAWRGSGDPFAVLGADGLVALPEGQDPPAEQAPELDVVLLEPVP